MIEAENTMPSVIRSVHSYQRGENNVEKNIKM